MLLILSDSSYQNVGREHWQRALASFSKRTGMITFITECCFEQSQGGLLSVHLCLSPRVFAAFPLNPRMGISQLAGKVLLVLNYSDLFRAPELPLN